jgi:hypothetical protein
MKLMERIKATMGSSAIAYAPKKPIVTGFDFTFGSIIYVTLPR